MGHPITGEHKYSLWPERKADEHALRNEFMLQNLKKLKPSAICQNLLRKAVGQRGLLCQ
jgi:hypothetical protein